MSAADLEVEAASLDELEDLVDLVNTAYGRTSKPAGWTSEADLVAGPRIDADRMAELIERPDSVVLVAEVDGETVGCVHLQRQGDSACELGLLSVRPDRQAEGLGRRLLSRAEAYARRELDAERIVLHVVDAREALIAWYERRGYERTGETEPFEPPGDQRSLAGPLAFVVLETA